MTTVSTPLAAADAIQRVPVACWLGESDHPQGFPNFPLYVDDDNVAQRTIDTATRCLWDGAFGWETAKVIELIGEDPSKIPADASGLDRAALLALYPPPAPEPIMPGVTP